MIENTSELVRQCRDPIAFEGDDLEAARTVALFELLRAGTNLMESDFEPEEAANLFAAIQLVNVLGFEPSSPLYGVGAPVGDDVGHERQGRTLAPTAAGRLLALAARAEQLSSAAIGDRARTVGAGRHGDLVLHDRCLRVQGVIREAVADELGAASAAQLRSPAAAAEAR
jgi:hypothetical protein